MDKTKIKEFAVWARKKLIAEITYKAGLLGITEKGIAPELPASTDDLKLYDIGTKAPARVEGAAIVQRRNFAHAINDKAKKLNYKDAFEYIIEEVAYTWFNRLIAVRFMEVNGYLPARVLSSEMEGKSEPDIVTDPSGTGIDFSDSDREHMSRLKDDELFRFLFIKQCNELSKIMPELFEKENNYMELLLTLSFTDKESVVCRLVKDITEDNFKEQVQIVGWLYQYYNTEPKQRVFDGLKKNIKITKENIPAATQLFTPDWIVRYMVENSLGKLWADSHSSFDRSEWEYYIDEAEQEEEVQKQLDEMRREHSALKPEDIRCIDPCCGSGHILCYMFDVLMKIYESCGYTSRDAVKSIIENNLYGLDIDPRAAQLAYFAVMMKACGHDKRFLSRYAKKDELPPQPQVYSPKGDEEGETFGALLKVEKLEPMPEEQQQLTLEDNHKDQLRIWNFRRLLTQKYDIVCTNPPYRATSDLIENISSEIKIRFPVEKTDLFACFIEQCSILLKNSGYYAMITQHAWMFLSSYEKLRKKISQKTIVNMIHLGSRAFEEIGGEVVQTSAFVLLRNHIKCYKGTYCRLVEPTTQRGKEDMFLAGENRYIAQQENFKKIPGSPVAYWVSEAIFNTFNNIRLGDIGVAKAGLSTGNNDRFLKFWFEPAYNMIDYSSTSREVAKERGFKWFPHTKGGEYRKWYGNLEYVVDWHNDGYEIRHYMGDNGKIASRPQNMDYYFLPAITWTNITTGKPSFRILGTGFIQGARGPSIFIENPLYYLGLTNSVVSEKILEIIAPTITFEIGHISAIPVVFKHKSEIDDIVIENITLSRTDWDSFETSWDFKKHPLI